MVETFQQPAITVISIQSPEQMGFVSDEQARRLWINYNRRGWKTKEPMDDQLRDRIEQPIVLRRAFETLIEQRIIPRHEVVSSLPFDRVDIEDLSNLPHGYLDQDSPYVWATDSLDKG